MNFQSVTININFSLLHEIGAGQAAKLERQALFNPAGWAGGTRGRTRKERSKSFAHPSTITRLSYGAGETHEKAPQ